MSAQASVTDGGTPVWLNLLVAATAAMLAAYTLISISARGLFEYWGADYRAFRSAAEVARDDGYAAVYDLALLEPPQRRLVEMFASPAVQSDFAVIPVPYLPVFVLPFRLILAFNPVSGWLLWAGLNTAVLLAYSRRLGTALGGRPWLSPLILLFSLPAFLTIAFGQVNVWLLIGFGEFLIAVHRARDFAAGMFLGVMLLKPQILVLLVAGLVIGRRWRTLAGLGVAAALVLGASLGLAGAHGLSALALLWLGYTGDMPTTYPESMMNWRGLMVNLEPLLGNNAAAALALIGLLGTAIIGVWIWRWGTERRDTQPLAAGAYAASSTVAWHAHAHMALPLLGLLGGGSAWARTGTTWLLALGVLPSLVFSSVGLFIGAGAAHRLAGSLLFVTNLAVLAAAASYLRPRQESAPPPPSVH